MYEFWGAVIEVFLLIIPLFLIIAIFTLFERKFLASIQIRKGPQKIGILGMLQPFADGLKLLLKEIIVPRQALKRLFVLSPILGLSVAIFLWLLVPYNLRAAIVDSNVGYLLLFGSMGINSYATLIAGWSSGSWYSFLGAIRATAQMISYEVTASLAFVPVIIAARSLRIFDIVISQERLWNIWVMFIPFIIVFLCALAECNRTPFDLVEAESELVSGFHVEYAAIGFTLIFLAEYSNILLWSHTMVLFFFGGWISPVPILGWLIYALKFVIMSGLFVWVRGTLARLRYDVLMNLGWKYCLPLSLLFIFFHVFVILLVNLIVIF